MGLNFHTHHAQNAYSVRSYDVHEEISVENYFTLGLHPWFIEPDFLEKDFATLQNTLPLPACLAIGECGLDRIKGPSLEIQQSVFIQQCELARAFGKPVVVHVVRCYPELMEIMKRFSDVVFAIHGFTGNQQWAEAFTLQGCYFSFGKHLRRGTPIAEVFKSIPREKIFLETDDLPNSDLNEVYLEACSILEISESSLKAILEQNWKRFFKIS